MEEFSLLGHILERIDLIYIIICNIFTYIILQPMPKMKTWWKRLISAGCALLVGCVMYFGFGHSLEALFYGFFLQFLTWDYLFKDLVQLITDKIKKKNGKKEKNKEKEEE